MQSTIFSALISVLNGTEKNHCGNDFAFATLSIDREKVMEIEKASSSFLYPFPVCQVLFYHTDTERESETGEMKRNNR